MPAGLVTSGADEKLWQRAKALARKQNSKDIYALTTHIFQQMKKAGADEAESAAKAAKAANPMTRADFSPADASPNDQLDRRAKTEDRKRSRFVIGAARPDPTGEPVLEPETEAERHVAKAFVAKAFVTFAQLGDAARKAEHTDDRRERNAKPENRSARREYMHTEAGRAANRKAQENYRNAHPERVAAQHQARAEHGESGDAGHKCAVCGKPALHKHHNQGYSNGSGGKIRWLCHEHHVRAHHPKSNLGEKSMTSSGLMIPISVLSKNLFDYGKDWYEAFRGTPLFVEAIKLEQVHMAHEIERRQKEKQREAARHERERASEKEESIWDWDRTWYAQHDARVADLKRRHLDWIAEQEKRNERNASVAKSAPSEHGGGVSHAVQITKAGGKAGSKMPAKPDPSLTHKTPLKEHREAGATQAGDYADSEGHRYPIHDEKHVRAAISYFNMPRNYGQYEPGKRAAIWGRIKSAAKKFGIDVEDTAVPGSHGEKKEKSMKTPKAFEAIMKGAILKHDESGTSAGEMAERMGAVALKKKIAKAELKYAKAMKKAADAESFLARIKKGDGGTHSIPMVEHPRPGASSSMGATTGGSSELTGAGEEHPAMVDHPRPGQGGEAAAKAIQGMPHGIGAARPHGGSTRDVDEGDDKGEDRDEETKKSLKDMNKAELEETRACALAKAEKQSQKLGGLRKALSTTEHGEAGLGAGAFTGATRTSADLGRSDTAGVDAEPFGSLGSMNGMPSVSPGQSEVFSEDDREVTAQMTDGQSALEETMAHGSSGLETSAHQVMGGDVSAGSGMAKGATYRGAQATFENDAARSAYIAQFRQGQTGTPGLGVGVPPPARDPTAPPSRGQQWAHGMVHYSTSEDARVSGLQKSQAGVYGGALGEPTLNFQAPILRTKICGLCKSQVPAMFARCPACGGDHATGAAGGGQVQSAVLSKSVVDSLRGPVHEGAVHPGGVLVIPE